MIALTEGNLQISVQGAVNARKFDDDGHGLSHCMKAVDFILEFPDHYLFIEFKDPDAPDIPQQARAEFLRSFEEGQRDEELKHKYRDSFLCEWASGRADKAIYYLVLIAQHDLSPGDMLRRTNALERILPLQLPSSVTWTRPIVSGCGVFNIDAWNRNFPDYPRPPTHVARVAVGCVAGLFWRLSTEPRSSEMQFGLFMMPLHPPHRSYADSYDRDLDLLQAADRLGFHEAWIGEHLTERWENAPFPDLLIAKASALTENIRLATGVTLLPIHNPIELAHRIAMLDHLTRGRLYWGIGHRRFPLTCSCSAWILARATTCGGGPPRCWTSC